MKTLTFALTFAFALGFTTLSFAGNKPSLSYPQGQFTTTSQTAEVTPWHKAVLDYPAAVVVAKAGNGVCPVMNHKITSRHNIVITLSNGKHMDVCCPTCKQEVEKDLAKYEAYLF